MRNIASWDDLEDIVLSCYTDLQLAEETLLAIQQFRTNRIHIYSTEQTKQFVQSVLLQSKLQLIEKISKFDNLTQLAFSSLEEIDTNSIEYKHISTELLLDPFLNRDGGTFGIISGGLGTGKTHFAVLLVEKFLDKGFVVHTNIPILSTKEDLHLVWKFSEFVHSLAQAKKERKRSIFILDEGALAYKKQDATTSTNKVLDSFWTMLRKLDTSILYIVQTDFYTPTLAAFFTNIRYQKPSKKRVDIYYGEKQYSITNIPARTLPFNTKARSFFKIDLKKYEEIEKIFKQYNI